MSSSISRVPNHPSHGTSPTSRPNKMLTASMLKRYEKLSSFEQNLLAADKPIRCINRAIALIERRRDRSMQIAHAMMGLGPADDEWADLAADLTQEQKNVFSDVLLTMRKMRWPENADKTLAKLEELSKLMMQRLKDLPSESDASSEASSRHGRFSKAPESSDALLQELDRQRQLVLLKKTTNPEGLTLKVERRHELLQALTPARQENDTGSSGRFSRAIGSHSASIKALTESILSSEECSENRSALLSDAWHSAECDSDVDSEISRFLLRKMQEEFQENSRMGRAISASTYAQYPLMFAVSHLCEEEFATSALSRKYADQAWKHLSQAPCSAGEVRLLASALAKMAQFDLMHWFLEMDGYSLKALKPLLALGSASWLRELTASFVGLKSPAKTRALQAAVTALGSPRVADIVRKCLGDHWVEPAAKRPAQRRSGNYVAKKVSGIGATIAAGLHRLLR